jgi:SAM-dependent methyltransferase
VRINDPAHVAAQYETETGLAARKSVYRQTTGPDPRRIALEATLERRPERILEVGCGEGELAEQLAVGAEVVAVDQSPRMVELTARRGVEARVADVQALPFPDASFDAVLAAWMLYHVPSVARALEECALVLRPDGRLVAATNGNDHLEELLALGGLPRWDLPFSAEDAMDQLGGHFTTVEPRDAVGAVTFTETETIREYFGSSPLLAPALERLPDDLAEPLVARRAPVIFVASGPRA